MENSACHFFTNRIFFISKIKHVRGEKISGTLTEFHQILWCSPVFQVVCVCVCFFVGGMMWKYLSGFFLIMTSSKHEFLADTGYVQDP